MEVLYNIGVSNCVAIASLVVAIIALVRTSYIDRKYKLKLQKIELESNEKADIRVEVVKEIVKGSGHSMILGGDYTMHFIRVRNVGKSAARNIKFDSDMLTHFGIAHIDTSLLPYEILNTEDTFDIQFQPTTEALPKYLVRLTWDDEYGNGRSRDTVVAI